MEVEKEQDSIVTEEETFVLAPSNVESSKQVSVTRTQEPTASGGITSRTTTKKIVSGATGTSYKVVTEEVIVTEEVVVVLPTEQSESQSHQSTKQVAFSHDVEENTSSREYHDEAEMSSVKTIEEEDNDDTNFTPVKLYRYLFRGGKGQDSGTADFKGQSTEEQIALSESQEYEEFPHYDQDGGVADYEEDVEAVSVSQNVSNFSAKKIAGRVTSRLRGFLQTNQQEGENEEPGDSGYAVDTTKTDVTEIQQASGDEVGEGDGESTETAENESAENLPVFIAGKFRSIFNPYRREEKESGHGVKGSEPQVDTIEGDGSTTKRFEEEIHDGQAEGGGSQETETRTISVTERIKEFWQPKTDKKKEWSTAVKSEISEARERVNEEEFVVSKTSSQEETSPELLPDEEVAQITSYAENAKQDSAENLPVLLADRFKGLFQTKRNDALDSKIGSDQAGDSGYPISDSSKRIDVITEDEVREEETASTQDEKSSSGTFASSITSRFRNFVQPKRDFSEREDRRAQESNESVDGESVENLSVITTEKLKSAFKSSSDGNAEFEDTKREAIDVAGTDENTSDYVTQGETYVIRQERVGLLIDEGAEDEGYQDASRTVGIGISGENNETIAGERYDYKTLPTVKEEQVLENEDDSPSSNREYNVFEFLQEYSNEKRRKDERKLQLSGDVETFGHRESEQVTEDIAQVKTSTEEQMPSFGGGGETDQELSNDNEIRQGDLTIAEERFFSEQTNIRTELADGRYGEQTASHTSDMEIQVEGETEIRSVSVAERIKAFQHLSAEEATEVNRREQQEVSESRTAVKEEITTLKASLQEQQPTEMLQQAAETEQAGTSRDNVKQDSAQNLPVILVERFRGFFRPKRIDASETQVSDGDDEELTTKSNDDFVDIILEEEYKSSQDVTGSANNVVAGGVTSRLRNLFQLKRTDKTEDVSPPEKSDLSATTTDTDNERTEDQPSHGAGVTEEISESTESVDNESAENLTTFLAGRFRKLFSTTRDEKTVDSSSQDEAAGGSDLATTRLEIASDDIVSGDNKTVTALDETTTTVSDESTENLPVFLAGKLKNISSSDQQANNEKVEVTTNEIAGDGESAKEISHSKPSNVANRIRDFFQPKLDEKEDGEASVTEESIESRTIATEEILVVQSSSEEQTPMEMDEAIEEGASLKSESSGREGVVTEEIVAIETSSEETVPPERSLDGAGEQSSQTVQGDMKEFVSEFLADDLKAPLQPEETEAQESRENSTSAVVVEEEIALTNADETKPRRVIGEASDDRLIEDVSSETNQDEEDEIDRGMITERLHTLMGLDLSGDTPQAPEESQAQEEREEYVYEEAITKITKEPARIESRDISVALGESDRRDEIETTDEILTTSEAKSESMSIAERIRNFFRPGREASENSESEIRSPTVNENDAENYNQDEVVEVVRSQQEFSEMPESEQVRDESTSSNEGKETAENLPLYLASRLTGFLQPTRKDRAEDSTGEQVGDEETSRILSDDHSGVSSVEIGESVNSEGVLVETSETDASNESQNFESKSSPVTIGERLRQFFRSRRETQDNQNSQTVSPTASESEAYVVVETAGLVESQQDVSETARKDHLKDSRGEQLNEQEITEMARDGGEGTSTQDSVAYVEQTDVSGEVEAVEEHSESNVSSVSVAERLKRFFRPTREHLKEDEQEIVATAETVNESEDIIVVETVEVVESEQEISKRSENDDTDNEQTTSRIQGDKTAENLPLYFASRLTEILQPTRITNGRSEESSAELVEEGQTGGIESDGRAGTSSDERISEETFGVDLKAERDTSTGEYGYSAEDSRRDFVTRIKEIFRPTRAKSATHECPTCGQSVSAYVYQEISSSNKNKLWTIRGVDLHCKLASEICRGVYRTELSIAADGTRSTTEAYYTLTQ